MADTATSALEPLEGDRGFVNSPYSKGRTGFATQRTRYKIFVVDSVLAVALFINRKTVNVEYFFALWF